MLGAVRDESWEHPQEVRASVAAAMRALLPSEELAFLMELSIEPLAGQLGVAA